MMRPHRGPRCRPPWWPDNEPWPPQGAAHRWRSGRGRFVRRWFVVAAFGLLMLCTSGALAIAWLLAVTIGGVALPQRNLGLALLVGGAIGAVGAVAVVFTAMRRVGLPLDAVMEAADRVAGGDYTVRVSEYGPRPIRALARAFNTMTERLQSHDRQRRDLMADVAHELRTPLTVMQGKIEGLIDGVYPRDDGQLGQVLEHTHMLSRLVEDLRTLALSDPSSLTLRKEIVDVAALTRDLVSTFAGGAAARSVTLETTAPSGLPPLPVDPVRIQQVLTNLLTNALQHTPAGGSVDVRVEEVSGGGIAVAVRDTGSGMTSEDVDRAFDRFHKGRGSRGSGLGLTIARNLVVAHGGTIHASSQPGAGTTITFTLPADADS